MKMLTCSKKIKRLVFSCSRILVFSRLM